MHARKDRLWDVCMHWSKSRRVTAWPTLGPCRHAACLQRILARTHACVHTHIHTHCRSQSAMPTGHNVRKHRLRLTDLTCWRCGLWDDGIEARTNHDMCCALGYPSRFQAPTISDIVASRPESHPILAMPGVPQMMHPGHPNIIMQGSHL